MWIRKFSNAARGIKIAVRGEISFFGHLFATTVVVLAGAVLDISQTSWCLLTLCIALVLVAEMFNTAIERVCRIITREKNPQIRDALDMGAGAVLVASVGAVIVGMVLLGRPLLQWLGG
jgi:diacylglycerol kinase